MFSTMTVGELSRAAPGTIAMWVYADISKTMALRKDIASRVAKAGKKVTLTAYHGFDSMNKEPTYFLKAELI